MRARAACPWLGALLLAALSCQVEVADETDPTGSPAPADAPRVAEGVPATAEPESPAAGAATGTPLVEAVLAHLLRYERRSALSRAELRLLAETVVEESARHDLDPALVLAVMHVESRYDAFAVSPKSALGLMQLLPSTGEWLAPDVGVDWRGPQTLFDPVQNVRLGVAYLRRLVDRYQGDIRTALLAYNWGPGRIDRRLRRGTPLPRKYAQLVFAAYGASSS